MSIRTEKEIEIMRAGGALLSRTLAEIVHVARPGVTARELDTLAEQLLREGGGKPSFKGFKSGKSDRPYPATICISINHEIVHAPGNRDVILKDGDIVGLDIGTWYKGLCTDMAVTVPVGSVSNDAKNLLASTREALLRGIGAVCDGVSVSAVGRAVEEYVKPLGYGIVRDLVGHGVGKSVHEDPAIPNFYSKAYDDKYFKKGMTVAIEPMLTAGDYHVKTSDDGWTFATADGSLAAQFEVTILVKDNGYEILTPMIDLDF